MGNFISFVLAAVFAAALGWLSRDVWNTLKLKRRYQGRDLGPDQDDISLIEMQVLGLMDGIGSSEDHADVQDALVGMGLTQTAASQVRARLCSQPAGVPPLVGQMLGALESASNGLAWYRQAYPEADSQADDEMQAELDKTIKAARIYLGKDHDRRDPARNAA